MTTPTPLPHAVAIQMCSDFDEASQNCGDPNHSPESCTCLKLARAWRKMESDLAAKQTTISALTIQRDGYSKIIKMREEDLAAAQSELASVKAENSKLRSALSIVHFKQEPWQ